MTQLLIQGELIGIAEDEEFLNLLRDKLGDDAKNYFSEMVEAAKDDAYDSFLEDLNKHNFDFLPCRGECDKVYDAQKNNHDELEDISCDIQSLIEKLNDDKKVSRSQILEELRDIQTAVEDLIE